MNKKMTNWANLAVAVLVITLSACGGNNGTSNPSGINSNQSGPFSFNCDNGQERLNNECVPANIAFEQKCAMAGGILLPIGDGICQNNYVETLRPVGFFQSLPPLLTRNNAANPAAAVNRGGNGRQYLVRGGDRLKFWGAGTYGKQLAMQACNGRNYAGKNVGNGNQNYYPYNGSSENGAAGDEEGFVMSNGTNRVYLGNNNQQSPTIVGIPGQGGLFVGLNQSYGDCANTNVAVRIQLEQCTNRSMQPISCP